ncbi:MAG TPA: polysaccharide biosynthesis/export family protein [Terracidiphilus sp.]|nr:polysaccharide biosynthesis/export family protein [Terracidiphilus sp.]
MRLGLLLLLFSVPLYGQTAPQSNSSPEPQAKGAANQPHNDSYVIGNDDKLDINVWKETEVSKVIPVRSDGKISLPLVGEIQASGRTPLQLEQAIAEKLKAFMTDPQVTVIVEQVNSKKYNILGEIGRPGSYSLTLSTTIMDAIAAAGGFRDFAKRSNVYILRTNADGTQTRINFNYKEFIKGKHLEQNVKIEPQDTIIVP